MAIYRIPRRRTGLGDLPAGLTLSTLPGHEGDVVNATSATITYNGTNYPPGYGTAAWWSYDTAQGWNQSDPNTPGTEAWSWNQMHSQDAAKLADMLTWPKQGTGYVDRTGAVWSANVYGATVEVLRLGAQPYSESLSNNWNTLVSQIYAKWGLTDWAAVSAGDPIATAKWIQASQDAATTQAAGTGDPRYLIGGQTVDASGKPVDKSDPYYYNAQEDIARQLAAASAATAAATPTFADGASSPQAAGDMPVLGGGGGAPVGGGGGSSESGDGASLLSSLTSPWALGAMVGLAAIVLASRRRR